MERLKLVALSSPMIPTTNNRMQTPPPNEVLTNYIEEFEFAIQIIGKLFLPLPPIVMKIFLKGVYPETFRAQFLGSLPSNIGNLFANMRNVLQVYHRHRDAVFVYGRRASLPVPTPPVLPVRTTIFEPGYKP
jgi:hypothetical protein